MIVVVERYGWVPVTQALTCTKSRNGGEGRCYGGSEDEADQGDRIVVHVDDWDNLRFLDARLQIGRAIAC